MLMGGGETAPKSALFGAWQVFLTSCLYTFQSSTKYSSRAHTPRETYVYLESTNSQSRIFPKITNMVSYDPKAPIFIH